MQYPDEYKLALGYTRLDNRVMNNAQIAARLDEAMKARGIKTQMSLAKLSGVPQPTIARILKGVGKQGPETETLRPIARALSVHLRWLQEGLGPRDLSSAPLDEDGVQVGEHEADVAARVSAAANELLQRVTEMVDTYRLASTTDRARIDLVVREIRSNLSAGNKVKTRPR